MLSTILLVLSIVIPVLVPFLLQLFKIDLPKAKQEELIQLIEMAVRYAEEYARTSPAKGLEKENVAVDFLKKHGVSMDEPTLRMLVKAVLNKVRGYK